MNAKRCPTCGQHVGTAHNPGPTTGDAGELELEVVSLDGEPLASQPWGASGSPRADNGETGTGGPFAALRRRPVLGLFLAAAFVLGGLQLVDSAAGRSEPSNVLEEAGPEEVAQPDSEDAPAAVTSETTVLSAEDRLAAERAAAVERAIARGLPAVAPYVMTYRTADGLVALSATSAFPSSPKLLALYNEVEGFAFLTSDEGTWAVNPDDPSDSFLVSYSSEVVATRTTGRHVYVSALDDGRRIAGVIINGVTGPSHDIPSGSDLLLVHDLGLLIMPPTGGTVLLESTTIDGFSEGRVVAATAESWVVQRCSESLECTLTLIDGQSGVEVQVPDNGSNPVPVLAPSGALLLYRTNGAEDFVYRVADGTVRAMDGKIDPAAVWSPDGSILAWIDGAELVIVDTAAGTTSRSILDIQPIAPALLITTEQAG